MSSQVGHAESILRILAARGGEAPVETDRQGRVYVPKLDPGQGWHREDISVHRMQEALEAGLITLTESGTAVINRDHPQGIEVSRIVARALPQYARRSRMLARQRRVLLNGRLPLHPIHRGGHVDPSFTSLACAEGATVEVIDFTPDVGRDFEKLAEAERRLQNARQAFDKGTNLQSVQSMAAIARQIANLTLSLSRRVHQQLPVLDARHAAALADDPNAPAKAEAEAAYEIHLAGLRAEREREEQAKVERDRLHE